jgi:hypothetical protein
MVDRIHQHRDTERIGEQNEFLPHVGADLAGLGHELNAGRDDFLRLAANIPDGPAQILARPIAGSPAGADALQPSHQAVTALLIVVGVPHPIMTACATHRADFIAGRTVFSRSLAIARRSAVSFLSASSNRASGGSTQIIPSNGMAEPEVPLQVLIPKHIRKQLAFKVAEEGGSLRGLILAGIRALGIVVTDDEIRDKRGRRNS